MRVRLETGYWKVKHQEEKGFIDDFVKRLEMEVPKNADEK